MRTRKKYICGQKRGGEPTEQRRNRYEKDYHAQEIKFHGSESAYIKWVESGKKGY